MGAGVITRTIELKITFTNGNWHSWDQVIKSKYLRVPHRTIAWIDFIKWYHDSDKETFTIRCLNESTTICRKDIRMFNIKEVFETFVEPRV